MNSCQQDTTGLSIISLCKGKMTADRKKLCVSISSRLGASHSFKRMATKFFMAEGTGRPRQRMAGERLDHRILSSWLGGKSAAVPSFECLRWSKDRSVRPACQTTQDVFCEIFLLFLLIQDISAKSFALSRKCKKLFLPASQSFLEWLQSCAIFCFPGPPACVPKAERPVFPK